jgi:hypothetical protein
MEPHLGDGRALDDDVPFPDRAAGQQEQTVF